MNRSVWVLAEQRDGRLRQISLELLTEGRKLANKLSERLCCVLLGKDVKPLCSTLADHGADAIFLADGVELEQYSPKAYASILGDLIKAHAPWILLMGATPIGRDLAPKVAARVKTGLITDCNILDIDEKGLLVMTKFIYGGKASATTICPTGRPQMATIRPGLVDLEKPDKTREAEIVHINVGVESRDSSTKVVGFIKGDPKVVDLTEAEKIVCGGGGVGGEEQFKLIEELAVTLDASIGGTRVAVDKGWIPFSRQIGQTGKIVSPEIFITCGASGAIHFQMGMKDSKRIIAINIDRNAPIFKIADVGVLGDLHQTIPEIVKRLKNLRATKDSKKQDIDHG